MRIELNQTNEGLKNLHIWRTGLSYASQKGSLYRKEWTNLYFSLLPQPPEEDNVYYYDIRKPFPFADNTFDAVYAMHVIEHLSPRQGLAFVREIKRVLRPKGICRLSTPDLEDIVRNYVKRYKMCLKEPTDKNVRNFHWAQLEVFDQLSRHKSGGEMIDAINEGNFDEEYLKERYGDVYKEFYAKEAGRLREEIRNQRERTNAGTNLPLFKKIRKKVIRKIYRRKLHKVNRLINGDPRKMLEANKWMHDRLSLRLLMEEAGLIDYQVRDFETSEIRNWERYQFDRSNFGDHPIEPSLYVEARKA